MKKRIIIAVGIFLAVQLLFWFTCWLGGYDFDHRSARLAFGWASVTALSLVSGNGLASCL